MRRREFIIALACAAIVPSLSHAQKAGQVRHIGILLFSQQDRLVIEPCLRELQTLGYVDGKTVTIEYRDAEGITNVFQNSFGTPGTPGAGPTSGLGFQAIQKMTTICASSGVIG